MMNAQYAYASEPRPAVAATQRKAKYRSDEPAGNLPPNRPVNIMYDRRIYRGNTYASPILPAYTQPDALDQQRQMQLKRKLKAARRAELQRRPRTPDAVEGRIHMEVQTELYLEELSDTVPEAAVGTQTDAFLDRAPSPLYVPAKLGVDVATQIVDGDLFDFDVEVEPLLEVLVGKTLDQARAEVLEEAELAGLRRRQRDFAARRQAELVEVQRLEQAERRRVEEKERRKAEAARMLAEKQESAAKVAAASFAAVYLANLVPAALASLQDDGFFFNAREREIQQTFLPWLTSQVDARVQRLAIARQLLDGLLEAAVKQITPSAPAPAPQAQATPASAAADTDPAAAAISNNSMAVDLTNQPDQPTSPDNGGESGSTVPSTDEVSAKAANIGDGDATAAPESETLPADALDDQQADQQPSEGETAVADASAEET
ncbi:Radial spoke head protein 3 [Allomyces arbusculus]|nr:Radial spoke head protein 3 [Allomyces arbusculus]